MHSEAHVPGRHLNGLLAAEGLALVAVDEGVIRRHRAALLFSYSGDLPRPLNRARTDGPLEHFCQHNVREGLAVVDAFPPDGSFRADALGTHTHSITSTLSSLAQLAEAQADDAHFDRVRAFYGNGLWQIRDELGWAIESTAPDSNPDKGEGNSSADILETALILGRHGDASPNDGVERIVRAHLLPSQLRDVSWIPTSAGADDGTTRVADRLRGRWGFPAPYGHDPIGLERIKFNLDIVGGVVASLAEVAAARPWIPEPDDAAVTELELRHRTRTIHVRLAGRSVAAMEDIGASVTFFPAIG